MHWITITDLCDYSLELVNPFCTFLYDFHCWNGTFACHVLIFSIPTCNPNISRNLNVTLLHYENFQLNPVQSIEWSNHWLPAFWSCAFSWSNSFSLSMFKSSPKKTITFLFQPVNCHLSFVITLFIFPWFLEFMVVANSPKSFPLLFIFFKFYFIFKLYIIVLVLPNIKMNPPQVYMCSPSWTLLPPHTIALGCPSALAPRIQYRASNLDWHLISYMIFYMFQCHSPKSSHSLPLPQSP